MQEEEKMTGLKRIVILWILAAAVCLLPAAAGADGIVIALGSEPTTLDPQLREDGGERAVNDNIYETLMQRTPDGRAGAGAGRRAAVPGRPHDLGGQAQGRRHLPQRRALQRRHGGLQHPAHHRSEVQLRADVLFQHHQDGREGRSTSPCGSRPTVRTRSCRRGCTG